MPDESLPGPPCKNPHYVPGGYDHEFPPVGSHFGFWRPTRWGYFWLEVPKQWTLKDPLAVTTPSGVRLKNPA